MTTDTLLIPQHLTPAETALIAEWSRRRDRKKTAKSFLRYAKKRASFLIIEEFHILIAEAFQRLHEGTTTRLMIFAPPRGGKSLMTSVLLPEWWMGNNPVDQILHTSYATTLVEGFGRQIRNTIAADDAFRDTFPDCALSKDSKSATKWVTTAGGVYHAAGVGTGIAGKGFHLGICINPATVVATPRGGVPVSELQQGDEVIGGRVIQKSLTTHEKEYTINARLKVSGEHPIWTFNRGWVPAKELRVGDRMKTLTVWRQAWERLSFFLRRLRIKHGEA